MAWLQKLLSPDLDALNTRAVPLLAELHWLPIKHRIHYKIAVTAFKVLTTQQPSYLANIIRLRAASRQLRSCGRNLLHDDRTNLAFADRAFSHAAPAVWNSLPPDIVSDLSCLAAFKRLVKTELYNRAYLRWLVTTRTCDSSLCEWLNVRHQPRNNNNNNTMDGNSTVSEEGPFNCIDFFIMFTVTPLMKNQWHI